MTVAESARPPNSPSRQTTFAAAKARAKSLPAREVLALELDAIDVAGLPAKLHNYPQRIPKAMQVKIRAGREAYDEILCRYGDCGTGGELDRVLKEEGVKRIEGAHCYAFYAGDEVFAALAEEEPGTFYLTDFFVRHFDAIVIRGLGLDRFPELRDDYFGNYRRLVHLAQFDDSDLETKARAAAERLGVAYERRFTGLGGIGRFLKGDAREGGVLASVTILYWRDIPSQVIVKAERSSAKVNCRSGSFARSTRRRCTPARRATTLILRAMESRPNERRSRDARRLAEDASRRRVEDHCRGAQRPRHPVHHAGFRRARVRRRQRRRIDHDRRPPH
jgi:Protein of unknown function (DUF1638)